VTTRVLFLVPRGFTHPSVRFRVYQLLPYFERAGHVEIVDVITVNGKLPPLELASTLFSLVRQSRRSDVIFIHRVPLPIPLLRGLAIGHKMVFDFDDAIFVPSVNWPVGKDFGQRKRVINYALGQADVVIAGNDYLADYARHYSDNVVVISTVVDTGQQDLDASCFNRWKFSRQVFRPAANKEEVSAVLNPVVVGWIGTPSNIQWPNIVGPSLKTLQEKHSVQVKIVSSREWHFPGLQVTNKAWRLEDEVADVQSFDIGLMPLDVNDPFLKGKCGFKIIEYMATGCPAVASAVGINSEIIKHGLTGFLVSDASEWVGYLERLVQDPALRSKMGQAARRRAVENYSVASVLPRYLSVFEGLAD